MLRGLSQSMAVIPASWPPSPRTSGQQPSVKRSLHRAVLTRFRRYQYPLCKSTSITILYVPSCTNGGEVVPNIL